jgi:TPR repeat protein
VQQETFAEWKSRVLEEAVEAIGAKLESQGRIQQDAIAELKTSLLDLSRTLSDRLESAESKQAETMAELRAEFATAAAPAAPVQPATTMLNATAEVAHDDDTTSGSTAPANSVSKTGDAADHVVLELSAQMQDGHPEDRAYESTAGSSSPKSEGAHSDRLVSHREDVTEPLQPKAALARDDATKTPPYSSSYLSAARQSLQAAAVRTATETSSKDLFGIRFLRSNELLAKRNGETTSYALLAGIALVTILAILIAVSQYMGRSTPASDVVSQAAPASVSTHPHAMGATITPAKHLATQRPLSVAEMQSDPGRLAMLANMGNAQAQLLLGIHDLGTNDAEAAKWLAQAAAQGDAEAQYRLGALYAAGRGVKADAALALRWYQAAANAGHRKAMFSVALAYAQGQGTAKNPQQAARWFEKAAQLGLVDAQFNLAVLYERGLGVPQSLTDAYRWYAIAARVGDRESKDRIEALASQLSPSDRAAAEVAAEAFKPVPVDRPANSAR